MVQLVVPQRHREAMTAIAGLGKAAVDDLCSKVGTSARSQRDVRELLTVVAEHDLAFDALTALNATRLSHGIAAGDAAAQVLASLSGAELSDYFAALLEHPLLVQFAKVLDLAGAAERRLHSARLLTDLRPVFQEDPTCDVDAVLINQTLQLSMFVDGTFEEMFIALEAEDLVALRSQIDRALSKAETARRLVERSGASVVELEDGE